MKKVLAVLMVVALCLSVTTLSYAGDYGKKSGCYVKKGGYLESKVLKKAHFILSNKEELSLSDEQYDKIKAMKISVKKNLIKQDAQIDLLAIDIKTEMWEDKPNVAAIDKLIDQKYDLKKEKAKMLVKTYVDMKGILSDSQMDEMKALYKKCKE